MQNVSKLFLVFAVVTVIFFVLSGVKPFDYLTWVLEVVPAVIGAVVMAYYWKRFRVTDLLFVLICIHCWILFLGGHYTYALTPPGFWVRDLFGLTRNHYDRLGHFAQGFVPAFLAREILLRNNIVKKGPWLQFIVVSICLGFSAFYELIEFSVAVILKSDSDAFLGTQGDVWDTQKDMLLALIGSLTALCFSKWHDRAIAKV
ncbi:MAG: DUF2238 domain-containing protein [Bdellovibrionaceae bacterium]|nr:DUF2238 domain-containing protein [Bdellovibrio sp.]